MVICLRKERILLRHRCKRSSGNCYHVTVTQPYVAGCPRGWKPLNH